MMVTQVNLTGEQRAFIRDCRFRGMRIKQIIEAFEQRYQRRLACQTIYKYKAHHMPRIYLQEPEAQS